MKMLLYVIIVILFLFGLLFVVLSISSRKQPELGLFTGQLRACPATPNCVCSEWPVAEAYVKPLSYSIAHDDAWSAIKQAIVSTGGTIITEQTDYMHAQYVTPLMRYVDDVEVRVDADKHLIHLRSASRVGHSDLGANRQRVARIRAAFDNQMRTGAPLH